MSDLPAEPIDVPPDYDARPPAALEVPVDRSDDLLADAMAAAAEAIAKRRASEG